MIYRIAQFLVGESLASNVDGLEPVKFLAGLASAEVHHQFVAEYPLLNVRLQIAEVHLLCVDGHAVDARHILADADGALLSVHHLVGAVGVGGPVHHIQWKTLQHSVDNGLPLFVLVDEFPLVGRTYVQFAAVGCPPFSASSL